MMQQLTGHTVNSIDAKQRSRQKILQFHKLPSKKRHKPSRKKITTHSPIHIMPEKSLIQELQRISISMRGLWITNDASYKTATFAIFFLLPVIR